jgi:hypothetical protein
MLIIKMFSLGILLQNSQSTTTIVHRVIAKIVLLLIVGVSLCCFPPMWSVLPLPLHCPIGWSFVGGERLVVARLWQKLLHFK